MRYLLLFIVYFITFQASAQKLDIQITNIDASKGGYIMLSFFNSDENFLDDDAVILKQRKEVTTNSITFVIENLPLATYSISVAHDEDSNGDLNTNFIGIPTEGWGFSANPKLMGPPTWDKTKFDFKRDGQEIEIKMNY